jgi:hypothetical protein
MNKMQRLILLLTVISSSLVGQNSVPPVVFHGTCESDLPRYKQWYEETRLPYGETYTATTERKQRVLDDYPKLKLQMLRKEVEKLLGKPDFAEGTPIPHLANAPEPADKRCNLGIVYIVKKNSSNMTDMQDVAVYLSFSRDGKLYWATPQNLPTLKPLGSPTEVK